MRASATCRWIQESSDCLRPHPLALVHLPERVRCSSAVVRRGRAAQRGWHAVCTDADRQLGDDNALREAAGVGGGIVLWCPYPTITRPYVTNSSGRPSLRSAPLRDRVQGAGVHSSAGPERTIPLPTPEYAGASASVAGPASGEDRRGTRGCVGSPPLSAPSANRRSRPATASARRNRAARWSSLFDTAWPGWVRQCRPTTAWQSVDARSRELARPG